MLHKNEGSLTQERQQADIGEKTYYDRRKKGLTHDEALTTPLQPGKAWNLQDTLTLDGETKPVKQWCKEYKVNYHTFKSRTYLRGWPPEKALKTPTNRAEATVVIDETEKTINEWCADLNVTIFTYYRRLRQGLTPADALTLPKRPGKRLITASLDAKNS